MFAVSLLATALFGSEAAEDRSSIVGNPAPPIVAKSWLNWEGDAPTLESLRGRVVLLEFWGTWCGPCVRAMPGLQKLHDRYRGRGLTVVALSYETPETMQPFLSKKGYTMPVASDQEQKTVAAYAVPGWPTTVIIDKQGKVAHFGSPYEAEAFVEKALGLETDPTKLLNAWLDSLGDSEKTATQREALQRLLEKATHDFDLQAWARGHVASGTVVAEAASPAPEKSAGGPADGADLLRRCAETWAAAAAQRTDLLQQLADSGPLKFDLAAFSQGEFAKAFPFDAAELKTLLQEKNYAAVVEAIAQRALTGPVLASASKDQALAAFCKDEIAEARSMAKAGLMAQLWIFPGAMPTDKEWGKKFFSELSISGVKHGPDEKSIVGVLLGGEMITNDHVDPYVKTQLKHATLMEDLATGKPPRLEEIGKWIDQERAAIVRDLESRYGKPEPHATK